MGMYACATELEEMNRIAGEMHVQFRILATGKTRLGKRLIDKDKPLTEEEKKKGIQHYKEFKLADEELDNLRTELKKDVAEMKRLLSVCEVSLEG